MKPVKKDKSGYKEKCCRKCRYWDEDSVECKRRSPTIPAITEPSGVDSFTGYWPTTVDYDWCGKFREGSKKSKGQQTKVLNKGR